MKLQTRFISRYINPGELFFDAVLILSVSFLYDLLVAPGNTLIDSYNINVLLVIIMIIEFMVISYLGMLFQGFSGLMNGVTGIIIKSLFFLIINGLFLLMSIAVAVFKILPLKNIGGDADFIIMLILTAPFFMALLASFSLDDIDDAKYLFYM